MIWVHALVALLFAGVALAGARNARPVAPRATLVKASKQGQAPQLLPRAAANASHPRAKN